MQGVSEKSGSVVAFSPLKFAISAWQVYFG